MATNREEVLREIRELEESTELLRKVLLDYRKGNAILAALLAEGVPTIEALERAGAPRMRPELTDALDQFAGSRHQARLALLALAVDEGASMTDAGRAFSLSRQLVSRTIAERGAKPGRTE